MQSSHNHKHSFKPSLSRRAAIHAGLLGAAFSAFPATTRSARAADEPISYNEQFGNPPALGRTEAWEWVLRAILSDPEDPDSLVRYADRREVIPIYGAVHAPPPWYRLRHNTVWFDVGEGFIHSSYVIPAHEVFNEPFLDVGEGFWGEVTVPKTSVVAGPRTDAQWMYNTYYGTVFWIVERAEDATGASWYRILDDGLLVKWWIQAKHVRRIAPEEVAPISPHLSPERKRIHVSIAHQRLSCLEDGVAVFTTRISTGTPYVNAKGQRFGAATPVGEHRIFYKRPSRHMVGGDPESITNRYDLPGVPWCTYFSRTAGAAIHGTFWHNNYGVPMSHGCINVPSDAAKWIYRWTNPFIAYDDQQIRMPEDEDPGATIVHVEA